MKIKFKVNRAEAFKLGIDTTDANGVLDVDPAKLSADERALIAKYLADDGTLQWVPGQGGTTVVCIDPSLAALLELLRRGKPK